MTSNGKNPVITTPPNWVISKLPASLLLLALLPLPFGYYQILRITVFIIAVFIAYKHLSSKGWDKILVVFLFIAIIYNPLYPVHFSRSVWLLINIGAALCFILNSKNIEREASKCPHMIRFYNFTCIDTFLKI